MNARRMKSAYRKLKLGMAKDDVLKILGNPDSQRISNGVEIFGWFDSEWVGIFLGGRIERRIVVEFESDLVVGFDGENIN